MSESSSSGSGSGDASGLTLKIKFKSDSYENFVERYGGDVSPGGIFIRSRKPLDVGVKVNFDLSLQNGLAVLAGSGTVVWVRQPDPVRPNATTPGMGIRFDNLGEESRVRLNRILAEKTKREREGKPVGRGPTPVPDGPFSGAPLPQQTAADQTAKVRLDALGGLMRDGGRPAAPVARVPPIAAPSQPLVRGGVPSDVVNRAPTPARGVPTVAGRAFSAVDMEGFRAGKPAPSSAFDEATRQGRALVGNSARGPIAQAGTAAQEGSFKAESTKSGSPNNDLLSRATPSVSRPVFARPTPIPAEATRAVAGMSLDALRAASMTGGRAANAGMIRGAAAPAAPAKSEWESEHTELLLDVPVFESEDTRGQGLDEKTTTVHGHALPAIVESFTTGVAPTRAAPSPRMNPAPQETPRPEFEANPTVNARPRKSTPELQNLFDGEDLPDADATATAGASLIGVAGQGRGSGGGAMDGRMTAGMSASGSSSSLVAHKSGKARGRAVLWVSLGGLVIAAGVFALLQVTGGDAPSAGLPPGPGVTPSLPPADPGAAVVPAVPDPGAPDQPAVAASATDAGELAEAPTPPPDKPAPPPPEPPPAEPPPAPAVVEAPPAPAPEVVEAPPPAAPERAAPAPGNRPAGRRVAVTGARRAIAAAESEADAVHWLRVRSVPPGADVFIDGAKEGQTPLERRMFDTSKPYSLSIRKDGFETHERLLSSSDPWFKSGAEFSLTVAVKLRKSAGAAAAPAPLTNPTPAAPPAAGKGDLLVPF